MRSIRPLMLIAAALAVVVAAGCANPRAEANTAAALSAAATEIDGLKGDFASLQDEVDSLRVIVAKQDTTITNLAAVNHVPITR